MPVVAALHEIADAAREETFLLLLQIMIEPAEHDAGHVLGFTGVFRSEVHVLDPAGHDAAVGPGADQQEGVVSGVRIRGAAGRHVVFDGAVAGGVHPAGAAEHGGVDAVIGDGTVDAVPELLFLHALHQIQVVPEHGNSFQEGGRVLIHGEDPGVLAQFLLVLLEDGKHSAAERLIWHVLLRVFQQLAIGPAQMETGHSLHGAGAEGRKGAAHERADCLQMGGGCRRCGNLGEAEVGKAEHPHVPVAERLGRQVFHRVIAVLLFVAAVQVHGSLRSACAAAVLDRHHIAGLYEFGVVFIERFPYNALLVIGSSHQDHRVSACLVWQIQIRGQLDAVSGQAGKVFHDFHGNRPPFDMIYCITLNTA